MGTKGKLLKLYNCLFFVVLCSEEAPASPSTRDAIQGMLSMANPPSSSSSSSSSSSASSSPLSMSGGGERLGAMKNKARRAMWVGGAEKKSEKKAVIQRPGKRPIKRPARHLSDDDSPDEQETLGTCFKDSDYGGYRHYPSCGNHTPL